MPVKSIMVDCLPTTSRMAVILEVTSLWLMESEHKSRLKPNFPSSRNKNR